MESESAIHLVHQQPVRLDSSSSSTHSAESYGRTVRNEDRWTETRTVRKRYLSTLEAASLIVNKMIGAGIFTTPGLVLQLTQSKGLALALWIIGGFYAGLYLLVYLDFTTALPFNGAELIYLGRLFRFSKAKLLPQVLYAALFVTLSHTAGNALSFARFSLIASSPDPPGGRYNLDETAVKIIAVLILAVVCFLLWISPRTGLLLSKTLAAYKIVLLIVLGIWGVAKPAKLDPESGTSSTSDWGWQGSSYNAMEQIAGFIYIIYSYTGYENACYVLGEYDKTLENRKWMTKIRHGALWAVSLVAISYTVLALGYYRSCTYEEIIDDTNESDLGIAKAFATKVLVTQARITGMKVNIVFCAFGNLIAVTYTSTKVKQAIALHHFLPFSTFLGSDEPFGTPGGSLLLHWFVSSIIVIAAPSTSNGYAFIIGLVAYERLAVCACLALGRWKLQKAVDAARFYSWKPWIRNPTFNNVVGTVLCLLNIFLLIAAAWSSPHSGVTMRYLWLVVISAILAIGVIYWYVLKKLQQEPFGNWLGWKWSIEAVDGGQETELDEMRRRERRDGTQERYTHTVVRGGRAAMLKEWTLEVIAWLDRHL